MAGAPTWTLAWLPQRSRARLRSAFDSGGVGVDAFAGGDSAGTLGPPTLRGVTPGERIDLIKALKPVMLDMSPADAFLHVCEFTDNDVESWPAWSGPGEIEEWCSWLIRQCDDDELQGLHDYLLSARPPIDESKLPWREGEFRLFLSHITTERVFVSKLAHQLRRLGVHGFVAHEHIEPGREWADVIRSCLFTCDSLVAVLHPGFHESSWTDQEVGFVMGQHKFAVAVRLGTDPYGFLGAVQGISAPIDLAGPDPDPDVAATSLARDIVRVLVAEPRTQFAIRDAMVNRLVRSENWNMSNLLVDLLRQCPPITKDQYRRLRAAQLENVEVGEAFNVEPFLNGFVGDYGSTT